MHHAPKDMISNDLDNSKAYEKFQQFVGIHRKVLTMRISAHLIEVASAVTANKMYSPGDPSVVPSNLSLAGNSTVTWRIFWVVAPAINEAKEFVARVTLVVRTTRVSVPIRLSSGFFTSKLPTYVTIWYYFGRRCKLSNPRTC
jgi:hypothetical protein